MSPADAPRRQGQEARFVKARPDARGLAFLYEAHAERLRRLLVAHFSDSHDERIKEEIEDAIQEAFCRMLAQRSRGMDALDLKNAPAYLFTAARNLCIDGRRRRSRERSPSHHLMARCSVELAKHPVEDHEDAPTLRWLAAHAASLTGSLRAVYSARFVEGLSQVATARRLGVTRRAVRTLERRLLGDVKRALHAALGARAVAPNQRRRAHVQRPEAEPRTSYDVTQARMARRGRV